MTTAEEYLEKGKKLFEEEYIEDAVEYLTQAISYYSNNSEIYSLRGLCYRYLYRFEEAIDDYTKCIKLDPDNAYHYKDIAYCYIKIGKKGNAMQNLLICVKNNDITVLDTLYSAVFYMLVYLLEFDFATALQLNYISSYEEIYYKNRAYTCVKMKKYDIAIDYFNKALEFAGGLYGGNIGEIYCDIAKCHNILGNQTDANRAWKNAIKHYTTVIEYNDLTIIQCNNHLMRANCYKAIGEDDKALEDLAKIIEIRERDIDENGIDYEYYFDKAKYYEQKNEIDKAKEYYMKTIKKCHEDNEYYSYTMNCNIVALCYEKIGENDKATDAYYKSIEDFTNSIEESPFFSYDYHLRADLYERIGNYKKAIEDYTNAIERDFGGYYYKYRANCYEKIKDYEKAIEDYKKALVFEYESLSDILEIQEKLEKLSKITSSSIKVFDNSKFIMKIIETPYNDFDEEDEEPYVDETEEYIEDDDNYDEDGNDYEDDDYDKSDESDRQRCAEYLKKVSEYFNIENNPKKALVELAKAYEINSEYVITIVNTVSSQINSDTPFKRFFISALKLFAEMEESGMSKEEIVEIVEYMEDKCSNQSNIDISALHHDPKKGRKLDL